MSHIWTDNPTEAGVSNYSPDVLNENLMYLKDAVDNPFIHLGTTATASYDSTLTGTVTATLDSATITGSGTSFTTECPVGSTIVINGTPCYVSAVASNTSLTISQVYRNTTGSYTAYKANNAKIVTLPEFSLVNGATIKVFNTNKNYGFTPSFNVNSTGNILLASEDGLDVSPTNPCFIPDNVFIEIIYSSSLNRWIYKNRIVANYLNGTSWYKIWTNGFIEQGGQLYLGYSATIQGYFSFIIGFLTKPISYNVNSTLGRDVAQSNVIMEDGSMTKSQFKIFKNDGVTCNVVWEAKGY